MDPGWTGIVVDEAKDSVYFIDDLSRDETTQVQIDELDGINRQIGFSEKGIRPLRMSCLEATVESQSLTGHHSALPVHDSFAPIHVVGVGTSLSSKTDCGTSPPSQILGSGVWNK